MTDKPTTTVTTIWQGGMKFSSTDNYGHEVTTDAPATTGASFEGLMPSQMLLVALAGCSGIDVTAILQKQRQKLDGLEIKVSGKQNPSPPWFFQNIHLEYLLKGQNLNEPSIERAINLSENKYCSVAKSLRSDCKLTSSYRIISN